MNLILTFIGVVIVYFLVVRIYRKNWNKNLTMDVSFEQKSVIRNDKTNLVLEVTNAKKLPIPMINTKFQLDKSLVFTDRDANSNLTDKSYRNDVFALGSNQRIRRKVEIKATKRGVYELNNLEMVFNGPFMDEVMVAKFKLNSFITVYPKAAYLSNLKEINNRLEGDLTKRKYLFEDKFAFRGIREYRTSDNLKLVNWKASAKQNQLMVNEYDETMSRNLTILLNLEKDREIESSYILENSIELASGFANMAIRKGIRVILETNAFDYKLGKRTRIDGASGIAHLKSINSLLARIDANREKLDFKELITNLKIDRNMQYVIISANRQKDLIELINNKFRMEPNSYWIVPHFKGEEVKEDLGLISYEYEIDTSIGGKE